MPQAELTQIKTIVSDVDSVAIVQVLDTIRGGRTLDLTGYTEPVVNGGHLVIREDDTNTYKPMPVSGEEYGALPAGHSYVGFVVATIDRRNPLASIMTVGTVNHKACVYQIPQASLNDVKTALPHISLQAD